MADLTPADEAPLLHAAAQARLQSHSPYSRFAVGAALLDEQGRLHLGANIENAAYPEGLCAEAVALAHLVMAGGRRVMAAAVVADSAQPITPCGGCRQKLREFAGDDVQVHLCGPDGLHRTVTHWARAVCPGLRSGRWRGALDSCRKS